MTINTREDLDSIAGTPAYAEFIARLKGSMTRRQNAAIYPADYNNTLKPGDAGYVAPSWQDVEDLSGINRFGFTKAQILGL